MIITIDGTAASGKSSASRKLAAKLDFDLLNTGAMYRAVGLYLMDAGVAIPTDPAQRDEARIRELLGPLTFHMTADTVAINRVPYTHRIQDSIATSTSSLVARYPEVREHLKAEQRRIAHGRKIVCEGRDQGTAVFPDAEVKFFFTASPVVRASRRAVQLGTAAVEQVQQDQAERDQQDAARKPELDPMTPASDAILIDTTNLNEAEVLDTLLKAVEAWRSGH